MDIDKRNGNGLTYIEVSAAVRMTVYPYDREPLTAREINRIPQDVTPGKRTTDNGQNRFPQQKTRAEARDFSRWQG